MSTHRGEPLSSPAPGTPQTAYKAYAAAALSFLALVLAYWIADAGSFTSKDLGEAILTALVGSGVTGGVTRYVRNAAK